MRIIDLPPLASSLTESIRDIGYSLNTAVADIIDNSISANAKNVNVYSHEDEGVKFAIIDDGIGLAEDDLINAIYAVSNSEAIFSKAIKKSLASESDNILSILNDKELEILKSLAKGIDLRNIANNINISYKTAANYQTSIKQKLELKTSMDLFQLAKDNGLVE